MLNISVECSHFYTGNTNIINAELIAKALGNDLHNSLDRLLYSICRIIGSIPSWMLSTHNCIFITGPTLATPHGSSVITRGNQSTQRITAMLVRFKLDNTLLTRPTKGDVNERTAYRWNQTQVTVTRNTCTTTVPLTPLTVPVFPV